MFIAGKPVAEFFEKTQDGRKGPLIVVQIIKRIVSENAYLDIVYIKKRVAAIPLLFVTVCYIIFQISPLYVQKSSLPEYLILSILEADIYMDHFWGALLKILFAILLFIFWIAVGIALWSIFIVNYYFTRKLYKGINSVYGVAKINQTLTDIIDSDKPMRYLLEFIVQLRNATSYFFSLATRLSLIGVVAIIISILTSPTWIETLLSISSSYIPYIFPLPENYGEITIFWFTGGVLIAIGLMAVSLPLIIVLLGVGNEFRELLLFELKDLKLQAIKENNEIKLMIINELEKSLGEMKFLLMPGGELLNYIITITSLVVAYILRLIIF